MANDDPLMVSFAQALREFRLEVWYQPKIDLGRKCLAGAQAVLRVRHPVRGALPPEPFLATADVPALLRIAERLLLAALQDWQVFDEAGFNLKFSVNLPVRVLPKLPLAALVRECRPRAGHWPGLIVDLAADQIARDQVGVNDIIEQLTIDGISLAIDEFGAGASALSSLRDLRFAELKLDPSLVRGCAEEGANAVLCQTAIDLAHRFGARAVAIGIDNVPDLHALLVMRCDFGQGTLLCPPLPKERFIALLNSRRGRPVASDKPTDVTRDVRPDVQASAPWPRQRPLG